MRYAEAPGSIMVASTRCRPCWSSKITCPASSIGVEEAAIPSVCCRFEGEDGDEVPPEVFDCLGHFAAM